MKTKDPFLAKTRTKTLAALIVLVVAFLIAIPSFHKYEFGPHVIAYCAQDQIYAEPIFRQFTQETGIQVRAAYDSEAAKTVGLANRLLVERGHPQCDVFWGNGELRTRQLAAKGVFRQTNGWVAVGYRSRRIVVNTNLLSVAQAPHFLRDFTNAQWRGKIAIAYPLFGSTATHFLALRLEWGEAAWNQWCRALMANKPFVVDGNSISARLVGQGEAWLGLADSDDVAAEQRNGAPVASLPMTVETLLMPNTIGVVRHAPHPKLAQRLFEYLQSPKVLGELVRAGAIEGTSRTEVKTPTLQPDWDRMVAQMEDGLAQMKAIFLR